MRRLNRKKKHTHAERKKTMAKKSEEKKKRVLMKGAQRVRKKGELGRD